MNKPSLLACILLCGIALSACQKPEPKEMLIQRLAHNDFEDLLTVDGTVEAVRSITVTCPQQLEGEIVYLIEDGTYVEAGDLICQLENRETQDAIDQLNIQVENAKANLERTRANLEMRYAQLDAQVKTNEVQTSIANLDSLQLKYASPVQRRIKELELQKAALIRNKLSKKLKALDIINKNQIKRLELQIKSRENRLSNTLELIDQMTIKAPQSGMAMRALSWHTDLPLQEGDAVWGNMPLVNIPDMTEMKVKIMASEAHYKRMSLNDLVEFTFDGMPGNVALGKIIKKAPIGQAISKKSKVKFFEVEASIEKANTLPKPGMSASCNVVLKRVQDTIVVPQIAIHEEDSMKMVYVKLEQGFERRQVLLGSASAKEAIIAKGLSGKETLSLLKPPTTSLKKTTLLNGTKKQIQTAKKTSKP